MSKNRKTEVTKEVAPEVTQEVTKELESIETEVTTEVIPEQYINLSKIEDKILETNQIPLSSEEFIKELLITATNEVKNNDKLVFQWLFIMYLEDMISKLR